MYLELRLECAASIVWYPMCWAWWNLWLWRLLSERLLIRCSPMQICVWPTCVSSMSIYNFSFNMEVIYILDLTNTMVDTLMDKSMSVMKKQRSIIWKNIYAVINVQERTPSSINITCIIPTCRKRFMALQAHAARKMANAQHRRII